MGEEGKGSGQTLLEQPVVEPLVEPVRERRKKPEGKKKRRLPLPMLTTLGLGAVCLGLAVFIGVSVWKYQRANAPILAENARLEDALSDQRTQNDAVKGELEQLEQESKARGEKLAALTAELGELERFVDPDAPDRETYLREQMVELLELRQELVNGVRKEMGQSVSGFFTEFGAGEYTPPEPIDVSREFFEDAVSTVTGEMDSSIAEVLGDVSKDVVESGGNDLLDTIGSSALQSIGQKVSDSVKDAALDALGVGGIVSAAGTMSGIYDTLLGISKDTPETGLALTLQDAAGYAQKVAAVLEDPNADTAALREAVSAYQQFSAYRWAAEDLRDKWGIATGVGSLFYNDLAQVDAIDRALGIYAVLLREGETK